MSTPPRPPDSDAIIDLATERERRAAAAPLEVIPGGSILPKDGTPLRACDHQGVLVDVEKREVTCAECKAIVDPIWVLHTFAIKERQFVWHGVHYERERKALEEGIANLKKTHAGIKSGINREPMAKRIRELERAVEQGASTLAGWKLAYARVVEQLAKLGQKPKKIPNHILALVKGGGIGEAPEDDA